jgi:hypothetical protein
MKTKIILDIKWLQEKRKTRPGKMIQTAEFLYLVAGRCSAGDNSNEVPLRNLNRVNKEHDPPRTLGHI